MSTQLWLWPSLFSLVVWGISYFTPKMAASRLKPLEMLVYQAGGAALFAVLLFAFMGFKLEFDLMGALIAVAVGILGYCGQIFYLRAITKGPISPISVLTSLYPALAILMALFYLGEYLTVRQAAGVLLAIAALIALVLKSDRSVPVGHVGRGWVFDALCATFLWAGWAFLPKLALFNLSPQSIYIYEVMGSWLVVLCVLISVRFKIPKSREGVVMCSISSFFAAGAVLAYLFALQHGPVSIIAVITALYPVITLLLARLVLKEKLSPVQVAAVLVALFAIGLMVS